MSKCFGKFELSSCCISTSLGEIKNYNFDGGLQLASQNYKICMRQEEGRCCIQYNIIAYDMGANGGGAIQICTNGGLAGANRCSGASLCSVDYIIIPGAGESPTGNPNVPGENYERFESNINNLLENYHL